jgi:hypothetical protein
MGFNEHHIFAAAPIMVPNLRTGIHLAFIPSSL